MTKVFLADDEIVIREGIRNSFPWQETDYQLAGEAPDGEIALFSDSPLEEGQFLRARITGADTYDLTAKAE